MAISGINSSAPEVLFGPPVAVLNRDPLVPNPEPVQAADPARAPEAPAESIRATSASPLEKRTATPSEGSRAQQTTPATFRGNFAALLKAVRSDDVVAAQQALSTLKSEAPPAKTTYAPTGSPPLGAAEPPALTALLEAVQRGNATGAKAALAQLENDALNPTDRHRNSRAHGGQQAANRADQERGHHGERDKTHLSVDRSDS